MPKRAVFVRYRQELSLDVSVGVYILLIVEQSSLESQSRGCAKAPILTVTTFLCLYIALHAKFTTVMEISPVFFFYFWDVSDFLIFRRFCYC